MHGLYSSKVSNTNKKAEWEYVIHLRSTYIIYHTTLSNMNIHVYNDYLQDYKGQKLAEQIFQGIILVSAVSKTGSTFTVTAITTLSFLLCSCLLSLQVIGFIYGFSIQQFGWTVYIMLAGFTISCLVCHKTTLCLMWS